MLLRIAAFSALGGFLFGYDLGLIGGALPEIQEDLELSDDVAKWIVGAAKFGAIFGAFIGGAAMFRYGRRKAIAFTSAFFISGPAIMAFSPSAGFLVLGRLVVGTGIGASSVIVPAYLGEMAPPRQRGMVVSLYEVMLACGMLLAALVDWALSSAPPNVAWRWMVGIPAFPAVLLIGALVWLPESPRWLVMSGDMDGALAVMHRVNHTTPLQLGMQNSSPEVELELLHLWSSVEKDRSAVAERRQGARRRRSSASSAPAGGQPNGTANDSQAPGPVAESTTAASCRLSGGCSSGPVGEGLELEAPAEPEGCAVGDYGSLENGSAAPAEGPGGKADAAFDSTGNGLDSAGTEQGSAEDAAAAAAGAEPTGGQSGVGDSAFDGGGGGGSGAGQQPGKGRQIDFNRGFWGVLWTMLLDIWVVLNGDEKRAVRMGLWLAFFNQACASTAIINYAPTVLKRVGVEDTEDAILLSSMISLSKLVAIIISLMLVDRWGRRPLLILGSVACGVAMLVMVPAVALESPAAVVVSMSVFILAFSMSWAGVFWVLVSELFSMSVKSPAASAATAMLFTAGALADVVFLQLFDVLKEYSYLVFAVVSFMACVYVVLNVPETKGRTLTEVQSIINKNRAKQLRGPDKLAHGSTAAAAAAGAHGAVMVGISCGSAWQPKGGEPLAAAGSVTIEGKRSSSGVELLAAEADGSWRAVAAGTPAVLEQDAEALGAAVCSLQVQGRSDEGMELPMAGAGRRRNRSWWSWRPRRR